MPNIAKKIATKSRDKLHADIIRMLNDKLALQNEKLHALHLEIEVVRRNQLEINHNQLALYRSLDERVKNSGTIPLSETEILTKIFSGLKMYLDPKDIAVVPHLAMDGVWEHRITSAWLAVVQPHDTVIDIGANFGYYGVLAAQKTDKKNSKVVFFEANTNLIPYLRKTLSVNWLNEQSVIENLAVSDQAGEVVLNVLKDYIGSSSIHTAEHLDKYMHNKMHVEVGSKVTVQATTIDAYCEMNKIPTVDLIKMDIEGFEDKAYQGMRKTIQSSPNITMFIEFTEDSYEKPQEFYAQMLEDFGHVYVIDDEGYITHPLKNDYDSIIKQSDDWVMPIFSKNANLANR